MNTSVSLIGNKITWADFVSKDSEEILNQLHNDAVGMGNDTKVKAAKLSFAAGVYTKNIVFPSFIKEGRIDMEEVKSVTEKMRTISAGLTLLTWKKDFLYLEAQVLMESLTKRFHGVYGDLTRTAAKEVEMRVDAFASDLFDPLINSASGEERLLSTKQYKRDFQDMILSAEKRVVHASLEFFRIAILEDSLKTKIEFEAENKREWEVLEIDVLQPLIKLDLLPRPTKTPLAETWLDCCNDLMGKIKKIKDEMGTVTIRRKMHSMIDLRYLQPVDGLGSPLIKPFDLGLSRHQVSFRSFVQSFNIEKLSFKKIPDLAFPHRETIVTKGAACELLRLRDELAEHVDHLCLKKNPLRASAEALGVELETVNQLTESQKKFLRELLKELDKKLLSNVSHAFEIQKKVLLKEAKEGFQVRFPREGREVLVDRLEQITGEIRLDKYNHFASLDSIEDLKKAIAYEEIIDEQLKELYEKGLDEQAKFEGSLSEVFVKQWIYNLSLWVQTNGSNHLKKVVKPCTEGTWL